MKHLQALCCAFMSLNAVNLVCAFKNVKAQQGWKLALEIKVKCSTSVSCSFLELAQTALSLINKQK